MRKTLGMLLLFGSVLVGPVHATPAVGFAGVTLAFGEFEEFNLRNHYFFPEGFRSEHRRWLWLSHLKTQGESDLYVQNNTWAAGGTTGWHTHPGASLIIVTEGTITSYEGDDPECKPHVYTVGMTLVDEGGSHVHVLRNETNAEAKTLAVQLIPHGIPRRIDAPTAPPNCPAGL